MRVPVVVHMLPIIATMVWRQIISSTIEAVILAVNETLVLRSTQGGAAAYRDPNGAKFHESQTLFFKSITHRKG